VIAHPQNNDKYGVSSQLDLVHTQIDLILICATRLAPHPHHRMDPALTSLPEQPPVAILPLDALQQTLHDLGVYIDAQSFVERVLAQHSEDLARAVKDQGELEKDIVPTLTSKCDVAKPANDPATVMETAQEIKPTASTSASTVEHQKVPVAGELKSAQFIPTLLIIVVSCRCLSSRQTQPLPSVQPHLYSKFSDNRPRHCRHCCC
jgi:hypothetical protein